MKKFIKLTALFAAVLVVALFGACKEENSKYSYWNVERYELTDGEPLTYYVEYSLQRENPIREIWINIDSISGDSIEVGYNFGSSNSGSAMITRSILEASEGWFRLSTDKTYSQSTVKIILTGPCHVNEVVVVDSKDKVVKISLKTYGEKATSTSTSRNEYTEADLKAQQIEHSALCTIDEQSIFVYNDVKTLFENAVKNNTTQILPN